LYYSPAAITDFMLMNYLSTSAVDNANQQFKKYML